MNENTFNCPRCQTSLTDQRHCPNCHGSFVLAEQRQFSAEDLAPVETADAPLSCPLCAVAMQPQLLGDVQIDVCPDCAGVWLDADELIDESSPARTLSHYLLFSVSLPERAVRSTIGLAAGAARETAGLLVPRTFQSSKTYEIVIENSLRFLAQDIGGAEKDQDETGVGDDYIARKAVGNFVDLAGLATLHVSPLWVLAIVSDVAYGTKSYVNTLADELKQQGLIDDASTIYNVEDILDAVQHSTGTAAGVFDTPPISVDELRKTYNETRNAVMSADYTGVIPESELQGYWNEMTEIAGRENVSLLGVSGAMTMSTLNRLKTSTKGALVGIQVANSLVSEAVLGHYVDALHDIQERGFYTTLQESSAPYIAGVWKNFSADHETWTEQLVTGKAFKKAWSAVSGWFSS